MEIADYYKLDLHIHTDKSNLTKTNDYRGNFDIDLLIKKLKKKEVDIFSLTDHNIFNVTAYEKLLSRTNYDISFFIGIELDLIKEEYLFEHLLERKSGLRTTHKKYHALFIFKTVDIHQLNNKLSTMYEQIQSQYNEKNPTKIDLCSENENSDLFLRISSLERVFNNFSKEDYLIIAHGRKDSNIVQAYKGAIKEAQNMILMGFINSLEMSPNKVDAIMHFNEGFDKLLEDEYKGRNDIPYVVFSDNHELNAYPNYDSSQIVEDRPFTWVKGQKCFETLRLAFVDPESRIVIKKDKPVKPAKYLETVSFKLLDENGNEYDANVNFSSGINVIIGGRSSGKSLLFNSILKNINTSSSESNIDNYSDKNNKIINPESIHGKMNFEKVPKQMNNCNTVAYTQEKIVRLFEKDGYDLSNQLPFNNYDSEEKNKKINECIILLDEITLKYTNYYNNISKLNKSILVEDLVNTARKQEMEYSYTKGIDNIKKGIVDGTKRIKEIMDTLSDNIINLKNLISIKYNNSLLFDEQDLNCIRETIKRLTKKHNYLVNEYRKAKIKEEFIREINTQLPLFISQVNSDKDKIIEASKQRLKSDLEDIKNYLESKLELRNTCGKISNLNLAFEPLTNSISKNYSLVSSIEYVFNKKIFIASLEEKIMNFNSDNLPFSFEKMILNKDNVKIKRFSNSPKDFEKMINKIKAEINDSIEVKYTILEKGLTRDISSDYMSPGKKASTFLEVKLEIGRIKNDSTIYLIDQPEDNLDNMFITDTLIDKFREMSKTNQIILVTHNAGIAINSDSDNIIIAENEDGKIKYSNNGLENIDFRKKVCKLLDGGYFIFDRRYHKYDIPYKKVYEPINRKGSE